MKKLIVLSSLLLFLIGCGQKENKFKVISAVDKDYLSADDVTTPAEFNIELGKGDWPEINKLFNKTSGEEEFACKIFVDENGKINKVVVFNGIDKNLDNLILKQMENWKINPAVKNSNNVKFQTDWSITKKQDGFYFDSKSSAGKFFSPNLSETESKFYMVLDQMPNIIGGIQAIAQNTVYPKTARDKGIEGRVFVQVYIDEKGNVVRTEILKGVDEELNNAAIDAVRKTKFTPGMLKGKPAKSQIVIPIVFKLK